MSGVKQESAHSYYSVFLPGGFLNEEEDLETVLFPSMWTTPLLSPNTPRKVMSEFSPLLPQFSEILPLALT